MANIKNNWYNSIEARVKSLFPTIHPKGVKAMTDILTQYCCEFDPCSVNSGGNNISFQLDSNTLLLTDAGGTLSAPVIYSNELSYDSLTGELNTRINGEYSNTVIVPTGVQTADNGITVNPAGNVQFGGTLIDDTSLTLQNYGLLFNHFNGMFAIYGGDGVVSNEIGSTGTHDLLVDYNSNDYILGSDNSGTVGSIVVGKVNTFSDTTNATLFGSGNTVNVAPNGYIGGLGNNLNNISDVYFLNGIANDIANSDGFSVTGSGNTVDTVSKLAISGDINTVQLGSSEVHIVGSNNTVASGGQNVLVLGDKNGIQEAVGSSTVIGSSNTVETGNTGILAVGVGLANMTSGWSYFGQVDNLLAIDNAGALRIGEGNHMPIYLAGNVGIAGQVLTSAGASATPTWQNATDVYVDFNTTDPNTGGTAFTPNQPNNANVIYYSLNDQTTWRWDGSAYVTFTPSPTKTWGLTGNTVTSTKVIGTKNNFDLPFITGNAERGRFTTSGQLLVGTTSSAFKFQVSGGDICLGTNSRYIYGANTSGGAVRLLGINASNIAYTGAIDSGVTGAIYNASTTSLISQFLTAGVTRMYMDGGGRIAIGQAVTPITTGTTLQLSGSISEKIVQNVVTYDRTFQATYLTSTGASTIVLPTNTGTQQDIFDVYKANAVTDVMTINPGAGVSLVSIISGTVTNTGAGVTQSFTVPGKYEIRGLSSAAWIITRSI